MTPVNTNERRADAARNREAVLEAATRIFSASPTEPSLRSIARQAGVGIATLYRHFPTRESLVDAVYRDQVQRLTSGAAELLGRTPPSEALRRWMDLFGDWLRTKHGMVGTLRSMVESGDLPQTETRVELLGAISTILGAGRDRGDLRPDISAEDVAASLLGIFTVTQGHAEQTARLLDLLLDGLRTQARR